MKTFQKLGMGVALLVLISFAGQAKAATLSYQANLALWLKPDSLAAGPLSTWADAATSVGGTNSASAASGQEPTVVANQLNGYSVVSFDGVSGGDAMTGAAFNFTGGGGSIFVVVNVNSTSTANGGILSLHNGHATLGDFITTGGSAYLGVGNSGGTPTGADARWNGDGNVGTLANRNVPTNTWHIIELTADKTTSLTDDLRMFYDNNVSPVGSQASMSVTADISPTLYALGSRLGASNNLGIRGKVQIAEVLVYNSIVTNANRALVNQYLVEKFFTAVPEPSALFLSSFAFIGMVRFARAKRARVTN